MEAGVVDAGVVVDDGVSVVVVVLVAVVVAVVRVGVVIPILLLLWERLDFDREKSI